MVVSPVFQLLRPGLRYNDNQQIHLLLSLGHRPVLAVYFAMDAELSSTTA